MSAIIQASFSVEVKGIKNTLKVLSRLAGRFTKSTIIQIRVLNSAIEISKEGVTKRMTANTNGEADIVLPASIFKSYFIGDIGLHKTFIFRNDEIQTGSSIYSSKEVKVSPVFSYRDNVLPNNISHISILRFGLSKSEKEIETLGLTDAVKAARRKLKTSVLEALELLKEYAVNYEDLEALVISRIKI